MIARLSARFAELSPRERRLVGMFGALAGVFLLFLVPYGLSATLGSRRDANAELRETLVRVQASKSLVKARKARRDQIANRYAKKAPKLGGFLEGLGKEVKLDIPELQDRPDVPIGKRYVERSTQLRLRKVNGLALLKFLEKIEQSGYPLAISRLNVRKRGGDRDSFDVEMIVSAYDRNDVPAAATTAAPAGSGDTK